MATFNIVEGVRPGKPIFAITRGYTEDLWEMTTCCWKQDPTGRPIVDYILGALEVAAEQWKPRHGGLSALSPHDDWSPTLFGEESDSPTDSEPENEPAIAYVPAPLALPPTRSVPPPLTAKKQSPPEVPATLEKEEVRAASTRPPKEEPSLTLATSWEEGTKPVPVEPPREDGPKSIPTAPKEEGIRPVPVRPSREEEPRSNPAAKDETKESVPLKPTSVTPEEANPAPTSSPKQASSDHIPTTPGRGVASPRKEDVPPKPTPATPLKKQESKSVIVSPSEEAPPNPVPKQGETRPRPAHPQKVEPKPRGQPFERESNAPQRPVQVHRQRSERHP